MTNIPNAVPRAHVEPSLAPITPGADQDPCPSTENIRDDDNDEVTKTGANEVASSGNDGIDDPNTPISRKEKKKQNQRRTLPTPPSTPEHSDTNETTHPTSRKDRRAQKKNNGKSPSQPPTTASSSKPPNNPPKRTPKPFSNNNPLSIPPTLTLTAEMPPINPYPLLICSIGNPGPSYANTLHSAGHTITSYISQKKAYTPFTKGLSGLVSQPASTTYTFGLLRGYTKTAATPLADDEDHWTFWQSTALMNQSGIQIKKAWTEWAKKVRADGSRIPRLVILHDELEAELGKVSVKLGSSSAKGHNGLKSCQSMLGTGTQWWRIGVGIGRPESREKADVSRYVLRKMNSFEVRAMEKACVGVVDALREIAEGKR
jgi:PTH1 family peptidyl-tRNA hydrolase